MKFADTLSKLAGSRFCCSSECCGDGYAKPCAKNELSFDTVLLTRLIVSSLLFAAALVVTKLPAPWPLVLLILSAVIAGYDILAAAVVSCLKRRWFDKTVVVVFACVLAFGLGIWKEGAALVLLFQLCGVFIDYAFTRTRLSVLEAMGGVGEEPVSALDENGGEIALRPSDVPVGARILLRPGSVAPCDCIVLSGAGSLDVSELGAGAEPAFISEGDEMLSGSKVLTGELCCEVSSASADSAAAALTASVAKSSVIGDPLPAKLRRYIEFFAPAMFILAIFVAGLIPVVYKVSIAESLRRALTFFILANPCSLFIAAPLIRLASMGGAAKAGIRFKSCGVMDDLTRAGAVAFDRAGTLSDGSPRVTAVKSARLDADTLLKITAHAMAYSSDKLARSVISAYGGTIYIELVNNFVEYPGSGVEVYVDSVRICAGSYDLMEAKGVAVPPEDMTGEQAIYVSVADDYAGRITLTDGLRRDAADGVYELSEQGVGVVAMFTDEPAASAARTAADLGIKEYYSGKTAAQQLAALGEIKKSLAQTETLLYVRSPEAAKGAHTPADIDVVMGGTELLSGPGSADLTLIGGVCGTASAIAAARTSQSNVYFFAFCAALLKLIVMVLAFLGIGAAWFAVFIDSVAALGAILASITAFNGGVSLPGFRRR